MESAFPTLHPGTTNTTNPTTINLIKTTIPMSTIHIVDLTILSLGFYLNLLILIVVASTSSMRTSTNIYFASLSCSSLVILIEPLVTVLNWFFHSNIILNLDYVCLINYDVTILTITMLNIEMYIAIFQPKSPSGFNILKKTTAIKGVLLIWIISIMTIAIELHIYDFFKGVMDEIYAWNTFMFTVLPCIIFFVIDSLIFYELAILKAIHGSWPWKELIDTLRLVGVTIAFLMTLMPYRFALAVSFISPKSSCCTDRKLEVLYVIAKTFPIIYSIIYIVATREFRRSVQKILCCRYWKASAEITAT